MRQYDPTNYEHERLWAPMIENAMRKREGNLRRWRALGGNIGTPEVDFKVWEEEERTAEK